MDFCWWLGRHSKSFAMYFSRPLYTADVAQESCLNPYYAFKSSLIHCLLQVHTEDLLKATDSKRRLFVYGSHDTWSNLSTAHLTKEFLDA